MTRVPISGIGVIGPAAIGIDAFRELLASGRTAARLVERFDTEGLSAHRAALVDAFNPRDFIPMMKMRRMNGLSRLAVAAARLAIEDCALQLPESTGVAVGTAFGPVQTSIEYMQEYVEKGPALASPQLFAESVANAPGSHIAIEWKLRGFNVTMTQRESSALGAAMFAALQVVKGSAGMAVTGGVEESTEMVFSVLDRVGALAHADGSNEEAARPFDDRRNGILAGEGAAMFVLGRAARAPYAWFSGFAMARDATASLSDWGSDAGAVVRAMRGAAADAGIAIEEIDAIYASANGSRRGDDLERRAIEQLFPASTPPVVAVKGIFGEYAAAGGLQLAAAALALADQRIHGSVGFENGPPFVNREVRSADIRHVMVNAISAGGGVVSAVLSKEGA